MTAAVADAIGENLHAFLAGDQLVGGAQVAVVQEGVTVANVAVGVDHTGAGMTPDHVSCVYCCSKIPVFTAALAALDAGKMQLDSTIGALLDDANPWVGECGIAEMLVMRGGFSALEGPVSRFVPEQLRRTSHQWLAESPKMPRGAQAYSVSEVGWLTTTVLERLTDRHYAEMLPLVIGEALGADVLRAPPGPLSVSYQLDEPGGTAIPMLNEATRAARSQWNPSLGWYASANSLARFGAALSDAWHGRKNLSSHIVRYATTPLAPMTDDVALQRPASFGLGFWTDMAAQGYGSAIGGMSFGHTSQGGTSFLVVDPEREVTIAANLDLALESDTGEGARRAPLVTAILEALDG